MTFRYILLFLSNFIFHKRYCRNSLQKNNKTFERPILVLAPYIHLQELNRKLLTDDHMVFGNHSGVQIFNGNNSIMVLQMVISPASTFSKVCSLTAQNYSSTRN